MLRTTTGVNAVRFACLDTTGGGHVRENDASKSDLVTAAEQRLVAHHRASCLPVASGTQLTYTIDVTNTADGAALNDMVLTDQVQGMTGLILTSSVGCVRRQPTS